MKETLTVINELKEITAKMEMPLAAVSLAFVLQFSGVSCLIAGVKNPMQVEQNASASNVNLPDDIFQAIREKFGDYNFFLKNHIRV
jgi:aryl-alcohol dehydrogenase-like predicted oxidoreductase